jgi:hypothetical protein
VVAPFEFATHTELAKGLAKLVRELEKRTGLREPITMLIAGGMATHLYTAARVTTDVDAEFSKRILLPSDLLVETKDGNMLYLDSNYNSSFALMHEDYQQDALPVPIGTDLIHVFVLSPLDLIVSKIARLNGPDKGDIAGIISKFHISAALIEKRAEEALGGYVGNVDYLRMNLREVLDLAKQLAVANKNATAQELQSGRSPGL